MKGYVGFIAVLVGRTILKNCSDLDLKSGHDERSTTVLIGLNEKSTSCGTFHNV
jgi:hypothetical protein